MVARLRRLARPRMVIGYRWEGGAPLIIGASPYARLFNPFGAPWSILFDLRSSLLTLDNAQMRFGIVLAYSQPSTFLFPLFTLIVPVVTTFAARVASGVVATAGAAVLGASVVVTTIRGIRGSVLVLGVFHLAGG